MANLTKTNYSPDGYLIEGETFESGTFVSLGAHTYPAGTILGRLTVPVPGVANVWTMTPTAANDTEYVLTVHDDATGHVLATLTALGDGTATATEICDDLRTQAAANTELVAAGIVGSGTATLILTGPAGYSFTVEDAGVGAWASITETTPATTTAATNKWTPYVAGATDGSGVPRGVLHEEIVAAGVADFPTRVLISGKVLDAKTKVWTGGSPVIMSDLERDTLRSHDIVSIKSTQLGGYDN